MNPAEQSSRKDSHQQAARLAQIFQSTVQQLLESHPDWQERIASDVNTWVGAHSAAAYDSLLSTRKQAILNEREPLRHARFQGAITPAQTARLAEIEAQLEYIETMEADRFDEEYPESRAGRIESALDRLQTLPQPQSR